MRATPQILRDDLMLQVCTGATKMRSSCEALRGEVHLNTPYTVYTPQSQARISSQTTYFFFHYYLWPIVVNSIVNIIIYLYAIVLYLAAHVCLCLCMYKLQVHFQVGTPMCQGMYYYVKRRRQHQAEWSGGNEK